MTSPSRSSGHGAAGPPSLPVFLTGFLCGLLTLLIAHRLRELESSSEDRFLHRVHELVGETYVDPLAEEQIVNRALSGLIDGLDNYSRFITGDEIALLDRETTGLYRGIGVLFRPPASEDVGVNQILYALSGSPADEAGLEPGDEFVRVDDLTVSDFGPGELREYLREHSDAPVRIELRTLEGVERAVELTPRPVLDPSVRHGRLLDAEHGVGYLSIASFSRSTPDEFRAELEYLQAQGARSLIVDLRGNLGGVLDAAVEIADYFVADGVLVSTRSRIEERAFEATLETPFADLPLVLLIDGDTASASEVLAGALQDHRAAVVVGEPSYGKGVVQTLTRFSDDRAIVKLTTSRYHTPSGRRIDRSSDDPHEHGIAPDLLVALDPETALVAHRFLFGYSPPHAAEKKLQAWEEQSGLELRDPAPSDAQVDAAHGLLTGTLVSAR